MNKTVVTTAVAAVFALVVMATVVGSAGATYRGTAGPLAVGINVNGNTHVYSVEPNGQDLQRLTTDPGFDACAAYSADGKRIAYCSGQGGGPVQVWTMNHDGTDKQQFTHMNVAQRLAQLYGPTYGALAPTPTGIPPASIGSFVMPKTPGGVKQPTGMNKQQTKTYTRLAQMYP